MDGLDPDAPRPRNRLSTSVLSNLAARFLSVVLGIVAVPFYLHYLGVEAYGLVGLFAVLLSLSTLLDGGFALTTNRFLSRTDDRAAARSFVRTLELPFWGLAALLAATSPLLGNLVADRFAASDALAVETVRRAATLMVLATAVHFPSTLYGGALVGLQRHTTHNGVLAAGSLARVGGGVAVVAVVPSPLAFFSWQAAVGLAVSAASAVLSWKALGGVRGARVRPSLVRANARLAGAVAVLGVVGALLAHADKLVVSRALGLDAFAAYNLGVVVASSVYLISVPVQNVFFPRMSNLLGQGDEAELGHAYHLASQLVTVAVVPATVVAALFAPELFLAWVDDPDLSVRVVPVARALLVAGAAVSLNSIPLALQLAHGWTRPSLVLGVLSLAVIVPAYLTIVRSHGPTGVAAAWAVLCVVTTTASVALTHQRFLKRQAGLWLWKDVVPGLLAAVAVAGTARALAPTGLDRVGALALLLVVSTLSLAATVAALPRVRAQALRLLRSRRVQEVA